MSEGITADLDALLTAVIYESDIVDRQRYMTIAKSFLGRQDATENHDRNVVACKVRALAIENELWPSL